MEFFCIIIFFLAYLLIFQKFVKKKDGGKETLVRIKSYIYIPMGINFLLGGFMKRILFLTLFVFLFSYLSAVPAHPLYGDYSLAVQSQLTRMQNHKFETKSLPENILVLRVDFPDKQFDLVVDEPDSLAHNREYFERFMIHLKSYWEDASHENYTFDYYVSEEVYTLQNSMSYYGNDELSSERMAEFAQEVIALADEDIDFSEYDATVIFHAGVGQETDLDHIGQDEIWSTFITRKDLQEIIDPENENYAGISADGVFIDAFAILPETTWQDYFPEGNPAYKYGILGLLAHEFGHHLGLPTLFDNVSSNGKSQGIGDFGIMGTGTWVGNGYVPPLPCAWSRVHLGWENPIEITHDTENVQVDYPLGEGQNFIYKVNISPKEYFLIENRQQNPDGSVSGGQGSFTFTLCDSTIQDVYPEGHNLAGEPKFNFMENTYKGCEWDFFLPNFDYTSGNTVDGSGLLIWHIDENIIEENFTSNMDLNTINNDSSHKGIDLEEADGLQHLDIGIPQPYFRGSAYDAYREGNNVYFGKQINPETGALSLPTSESYYGGSELEIFDISSSAETMTFSIKFQWSLEGDYSGANPYPAALVDIDNNDEINDIIYPMPNGDIYVWKEFADTVHTTVHHLNQEISDNFAYNSNLNKFYFPTRLNDNYSALYTLQDSIMSSKILEMMFHFSSHPVVMEDKNVVVLPLENNEISKLSFIDEFDELEDFSYNNDSLRISSNIIWDETKLHFISTNADSASYISILSFPELEANHHKFSSNFQFSNPSIYLVNFTSEIRSSDDFEEPVYVIKDENKIYLFTQNLEIIDGFPVALHDDVLSELTFADIDINGKLDIIVGSENRFYVISYNGSIINSPVSDIEYPDSLKIASGVIPFDIENQAMCDGCTSPIQDELLGNMSRNRFFMWDNSFNAKDGFPKTSNTVSRNFPIIKLNSDSLYVYLPSDNGTIYRHLLTSNHYFDSQADISYQTEFINLARTANFTGINMFNHYQTDKIFVSDEVYIYPNPHNKIFGNGFINFNVMVSEDTEVELNVFDVAGNLIFSSKKLCYAYLNNRGKFVIEINNLSSGVYFAVIKAQGETIKRKFGIEK